MGYIVNCECGEIVRAEDEDGVLQGVGQHVEAKHPDLVGTLSREDILAMAEQAQVGTYLYLGSYPAEGVSGVIADGGSRREADTRAVFEALGGRVLTYLFAVGPDFDFVIVAELPDLEAALVPPMLASATGTVDVRTTVLLTPAQLDAVTERARSLTFRAAGT